MDARKVEDEPSELVPPLPTSVSKLIEPLAKAQIVSNLRSVAARDPSHRKRFVHGLGLGATSEAIRAAADLDGNLLVKGFGQKTLSDVLRATAELDRKLFVCGFGRNTTSDVLRAAFAPFGEIDDCIVAQNNPSRSIGYGFVLFRHRAAAIAALCAPEILVEDRRVTCDLVSDDPPHDNLDGANSVQLSSGGSSYFSDENGSRILELSSGARCGPKLPRDNPNPLRKIYVGNVPPYVDGARLREFFARYGEIEEGPIGFDPNTGKSKGFVLFVYRSIASAREALVESSKNFEGHLLYCESPTGPPPNSAATAEAIVARLDPVSVGLNHHAKVLDILALLNRGAATTSANQGPAGYQGNPGSQGAQPPSYESGGGSSY